MNTKNYVITITDDFIKGFIGGIVTAMVATKYIKYKKTKKEEA